jgi:hypothetical protein
MGEMVAKFLEQVERCSHLETSGLRVCDLILGLVDVYVHLAAHLEEVAGRLQAM